MGLIKTGLTLAGGYGLIKAASKAVNNYEDKKQRRTNQSEQQYYSGHESQMGYMQGNQMNNHPSQPQWHSSTGPQYDHGNYNVNNIPQGMQPRDIRDNSRSYGNQISQSPPPYHQGHATDKQGGGQPGSAQEYYSGKKL